MQSRRAFQWLFVPASAMALAAGLWVPVAADQSESPAACRLTGRATSAGMALPGVSVVARIGDALKAATSTEPDGTYTLSLPAGAYHLSAELTGFTRVDRDVSIDQSACSQKLDLQFALTPRSASPHEQAPARRAQTADPAVLQDAADRAAPVLAAIAAADPAAVDFFLVGAAAGKTCIQRQPITRSAALRSTPRPISFSPARRCRNRATHTRTSASPPAVR